MVDDGVRSHAHQEDAVVGALHTHVPQHARVVLGQVAAVRVGRADPAARHARACASWRRPHQQQPAPQLTASRGVDTQRDRCVGGAVREEPPAALDHKHRPRPQRCRRQLGRGASQPRRPLGLAHQAIVVRVERCEEGRRPLARLAASLKVVQQLIGRDAIRPGVDIVIRGLARRLGWRRLQGHAGLHVERRSARNDESAAEHVRLVRYLRARATGIA
eukprot:3611986-Prymnesium_polylepis.2